MGWGISMGIGWPNASAGISYVKKLIKSFKARVLSYPNSIFEAEACLNTTLSELNAIGLLKEASLIITPNAYNEGVLYDVVPNTTLGDMDVVRATTATRVNEQGLIEVVGINIPRIDYSNGSCPTVLVEPQRTNVVLYSEQFDNSYWGKQSGATVNSNTAISPDGTQNADTINLSDISEISRVERAGYNLSANTFYTITIFLKNISLTSGQTFTLRYETLGFDLRGTVDLFNKTNVVSVTGTAGTGYVSGTQKATITELSNGWVRCSISIQSGSIVAGTGIFYIINNSNANRSFYAWGAQLEQGSYPTSYIPTTSTTVTRNADVISKTGISSLIGQTEGTVFINVIGTKDMRPSTKFITQIAGSKNIGITFFSTVINVISGLIDLSYSFTSNQIYKIALCYSDSGNFRMYVNGVKTHEVNTYVPGTFNSLGIGCRASGDIPANTSINSVTLYKTALTNSEAILLTTL